MDEQSQGDAPMEHMERSATLIHAMLTEVKDVCGRIEPRKKALFNKVIMEKREWDELTSLHSKVITLTAEVVELEDNVAEKREELKKEFRLHKLHDELLLSMPNAYERLEPLEMRPLALAIIQGCDGGLDAILTNEQLNQWMHQRTNVVNDAEILRLRNHLSIAQKALHSLQGNNKSGETPASNPSIVDEQNRQHEALRKIHEQLNEKYLAEKDKTSNLMKSNRELQQKYDHDQKAYEQTVKSLNDELSNVKGRVDTLVSELKEQKEINSSLNREKESSSQEIAILTNERDANLEKYTSMLISEAPFLLIILIFFLQNFKSSGKTKVQPMTNETWSSRHSETPLYSNCRP